MDVLVETGANRGDCVHKIVKKYGIFFSILKEKTIPAKFFGLVPEKVEVEFCLSPQQGIPLARQSISLKSPASGGAVSPKPPSPGWQAAALPAALPKDDSTLDFNEERKRLLKAAGKNPDQVMQHVQDQKNRETGQQAILDKLKEIQEQIGAGKARQAEHPNLVRIEQMLRQNDFSEHSTAGLLDRARKDLSLETLENFQALQNRFLEWIGESIQIYQPPRKYESGRIMVLVGPTGVGKTTTIAKLAAIYGIENSGRRPLSVRMITIDAFKIGAKEQIEDFGEIMDIPVSYVDNRGDLRKEIDLYHNETDLILVDTIGRSPRDSVKLGEMKELIEAIGSKAEIHLALAASTKTSDIEHILRQFEPFNYQAILLTKLDETRHVGNIISALAERRKPVSYITDGQNLPKDIKKASVVRFLINLDEFQVDREEIEKRFPAAEADQFQWG
ncbi:MAG: flagellar biosynthesis protein FlhF [Treponema sp.]|jgi:flagellar biosynthesis protein FlhF|nr:flagellar biosynthesis protein FlhF [Treponema sp.]